MKKSGLLAATYTPLNQGDEINQEIIPEYAEYLVANNIVGVFINGSTGDYTSLTLEERIQIMKAWSALQTPDFEKMVHVGSNSIREARELAKLSKELKMNSISAVGPYYFKPKNTASLVEYSEVIAREASLPFYYYHIPQLTGLHFNMEEFIERAQKSIPEFAGIKYSIPDLVEYRK